MQEQVAQAENIEVIWDTVVEEIKGDGQVQALALFDKKKEEKSELPVDGVFIAVGIEPNTAQIEDAIELDEGGYIIAGESTRTEIPGVYAVGDVRRKPLRQVITAAADGAAAVHSAQSFLAGLENTDSLPG